MKFSIPMSMNCNVSRWNLEKLGLYPVKKVTLGWELARSPEWSTCPLGKHCPKGERRHILNECVGIHVMVEMVPHNRDSRPGGRSEEPAENNLWLRIRFPERTLRAFFESEVVVCNHIGEGQQRQLLTSQELTFAWKVNIQPKVERDSEEVMGHHWKFYIVPAKTNLPEDQTIPQPVDRLNYQHLSDVIIQVQDKTLKCHKIQLVKASPVFESMFKECWEKQNAETKETIVKIDNHDADTVSAFIDYLYNNKVVEDEKKYQLSIPLLAIADQYQVEDLVNKCAEHLLRLDVTVENAVELWVAAEQYNLKKLKAQVYRFLAFNWEARRDIYGLGELESKRGDYLGDFVTFLFENSKGFNFRTVKDY